MRDGDDRWSIQSLGLKRQTKTSAVCVAFFWPKK
jgi:hypothetical protein